MPLFWRLGYATKLLAVPGPHRSPGITKDGISGSPNDSYTCIRSDIKLHTSKCHLYMKTIVWYGGELSVSRVRKNPRHLTTLETMDTFRSPCALLNFTSAMQWMLQSIPEFTTVMKYLLDAIEPAYYIAGNRTELAFLESHWLK